ncbi:ATP-binding cassette domain-containing protein [Paenibacillus sp. PAMC21692]|uniref:ATP-binding cassette domain-containing protein n=1 Tax=Paenibacillus sp. PAMC21692 TaxID=2762320 RepID=UPI00164E98F8|nr:ATP-binding cassette domain-containing protein [Paenibacillus sp. PAMC21692]QNK54841.1 ATP-binding cassette domain-containing protein [Paenibacillus sp. PAMC21692]
MGAEIIVRGTNMSLSAISPNGRDRIAILQSVNFTIKQGEWITAIGGNGSGKSTLAKIIAGMPLTGVSGRLEKSAKTGPSTPIVLQHPDAGLVGATPWEDVVIMMEQWGTVVGVRIPEATEDALKRLGLDGRMQQAIDTLSGGQKQLTAIAGCLAASPNFIILDEITSMLDPDMSREVYKQVRHLHKAGMTVLWITQKLEELEGSDTVWVMAGGEMAYEGTGLGLFRRSGPGACDSPSERYGFEPPYSVQVGWELEVLGVPASDIPLYLEKLQGAVGSR